MCARSSRILSRCRIGDFMDLSNVRAGKGNQGVSRFEELLERSFISLEEGQKGNGKIIQNVCNDAIRVSGRVVGEKKRFGGNSERHGEVVIELC